MIQRFFMWLKKKALSRHTRVQASKAREPAVAYTDDEMKKVKERLQGLGYIE